MKNKLKIGLGIVIGIIAFLMYGCPTVIIVPNHAHVIVENDNKYYHAPSHKFWQGELSEQSNLSVLTYKEAKEKKFLVDPICKDSFEPIPHSLLAVILEEIGLKKKPKLWNDDGSWNFQ